MRSLCHKRPAAGAATHSRSVGRAPKLVPRAAAVKEEKAVAKTGEWFLDKPPMMTIALTRSLLSA